MNNLQFPARININFALSIDVEGYVRDLNDALLDKGLNEIDFSEDSDHLPHLTLLMGEVNSQMDLDELIAHCKDFQAKNASLDYELSAPFWKKPSQKFLFIDTLPTEAFRTFRVSLFEGLSGLLHCEFHGGPDNPSHITIGYGDSRKINLTQLTRMPAPRKLKTQSMRVCIAGERGTCHTILADFANAAKA
jgi:hypothetical protein